MSLSDSRVSAHIAVSNINRAADFYEGKLGLDPSGDALGGGRAYPCGGGSVLHVYESPEHAGKATATLARWDVYDIEQVVDQLTASGVTFERYDEPVKTDQRGVHDSG